MSVSTELSLDQQLDQTLDLGIDMNGLRDLAYSDPDSPEVEEHFERIVNALWALSPSGHPDRVRLTIRQMPGNMEERFGKYCIENHRFVPDSDDRSPGRWWVISPENCG